MSEMPEKVYVTPSQFYEDTRWSAHRLHTFDVEYTRSDIYAALSDAAQAYQNESIRRGKDIVKLEQENAKLKVQQCSYLPIWWKDAEELQKENAKLEAELSALKEDFGIMHHAIRNACDKKESLEQENAALKEKLIYESMSVKLANDRYDVLEAQFNKLVKAIP